MLPLTLAASDDSKDQAPSQAAPATAKPTTGGATAEKPQVKDEKKVPEMNLLDAMRAALSR